LSRPIIARLHSESDDKTESPFGKTINDFHNKIGTQRR